MTLEESFGNIWRHNLEASPSHYSSPSKSYGEEEKATLFPSIVKINIGGQGEIEERSPLPKISR